MRSNGATPSARAAGAGPRLLNRCAEAEQDERRWLRRGEQAQRENGAVAVGPSLLGHAIKGRSDKRQAVVGVCPSGAARREFEQVRDSASGQRNAKNASDALASELGYPIKRRTVGA